MRRCLLTLTLLACVLVAPAGARAEGGPRAPEAARGAHLAQAAAASADPASDPQIAQWLAVARAYWAVSPTCPSGITLQRAQWLPDPGIWAAAVQGGCAIAFDPDFYPAPAGYDLGWWQAAMCSVVAHEYGHLLGLGHVDDPTKLMNAVTPINLVPGCPTWGLPSAAPAPTQTATTTPRRATKTTKRKTCAARTRRTSRAKSPRTCKTSVKRRTRRGHGV